MNLFDIFESGDQELDENLRKWFKDKWVRFGPDGEIRGDCARGDDSEGKPKCLPQSKAHALGKKGRASAAARKRREDPDPERRGPAKNVATKKKSNESVVEQTFHGDMMRQVYDKYRKPANPAEIREVFKFLLNQYNEMSSEPEDWENDLYAVKDSIAKLKQLGNKANYFDLADALYSYDTDFREMMIDFSEEELNPELVDTLLNDVFFGAKQTIGVADMGNYKIDLSKSDGTGVAEDSGGQRFIVTYTNSLSDDSYTVMVSADDEYDAKDKVRYALGMGDRITDVKSARGNEPTDREYKVFVDPRTSQKRSGIYDRQQGMAEAINPDITNPAFSHQQQIGDYLYVARYWSKGLKISAYHGNKQIGYAELMYQSAPFDDFADPKTTPKRVWLESEWTKVNPKYQRQGIMSTMYAYAKMLGNSVKPSELRSPDAKAAWSSWRQAGDAKHLTSNEGVAEGTVDDIEDTKQFKAAIALAKSQKAIRQAKDGKDAKYYADGTKVTPAEVARRAAERKAKKQGVAEGKMAELEMDLEDPEITDRQFEKMYGMTRKEAREQFSQTDMWAFPEIRDPNRPLHERGVAEAFGPLPKDNKQIRLGRHTVDIERVGLDKNYISFAWHDSKGQEHYEEVAVGDLGSYDDLIKKIKQEISYQERKYTDQGVAEQELDEACWKGYHKEGMKTMFGKKYPNCVKNTNEEQEQHSEKCPHCGGEMVSEELINEKKDACYYKVKSRYKVWPSAYASGALVQCRKKGASNWGTKSEGVTEGSEMITELRSKMYQYIKSILPKWPEYVLKDWVYQLARGDHQAGVYFKPDDSFDRWGFNRETILKMIADNGLSPDTQWQLIPNMKFTMDMFEPNSKRKLIGRAGGHSDMGMSITKDKERHATQAALAQKQGGVRKEPVILIKTPQGYELLEGWHRTIQHFAKYPDGYVGPAYVAVAQSQQGVAEGSEQNLSVQQLATISDEALDKAYGYGRSNPGNTFGWQANLMSAAYAKKMIDAGVTDIEKISDAIHKGWNVTAQKFVQNPDQFDDTEKLRQAGKLEAKLAQRAKLMKINYGQLDNEEQEKDRVVARALLQAIKGQQGVAEDQVNEKWSQKYKDSINCSNPKGFSQKAYCAGKKKNEDIAEGKEYYTVTGTDSVSLRRDFNMSKDRNGWYLKEGATPKQKLEALRAFGSPKLTEFNLAAFSGGTQIKGEDNVISPVGSQTRSQYKK